MVPVGMENPYMQRHNMTVHSLVSYNTSSDDLFIDGPEREKSLVRKGLCCIYSTNFWCLSGFIGTKNSNMLSVFCWIYLNTQIKTAVFQYSFLPTAVFESGLGGGGVYF